MDLHLFYNLNAYKRISFNYSKFFFFFSVLATLHGHSVPHRCHFDGDDGYETHCDTHQNHVGLTSTHMDLKIKIFY